jgi:hypothetical protein
MDPYLEAPEHWRGVHHGLITYIRDDLQPLLRPHYRADMDERLVVSWVNLESRDIYPDVFIRPTSGLLPAWTDTGGGVAVAEREVLVADEPLTLPREELQEAFLKIRDVRNGEVVTIIEILSPTNKSEVGGGRSQYLEKQEEVLASNVNLVEIDLLRGGERTAALPPKPLRVPYQYMVCVQRAARRDRVEVYPFTVRQRLPRVRIPLRPPDPDVVLDLPTLFTRCYDNGDYRTWIDYHAEPDPPLDPEDAAWADTLLREQGLRPQA